MRPAEVFLSHSAADRRFASRFAAALRSRGVKTWHSADQIHGARQWHDEIGKALRRCDWFVLLLSPNSVKSPWVKRELLFALDDRRYAERIIPILVRPCRIDALSWTLDAIERTPSRGRFGEHFDQNLARIFARWPARAATSARDKKSAHRRARRTSIKRK